MGRREDIQAVLASDLFDASWYRSRHDGAGATREAAAGHFLDHADQLGHDPGPRFSMQFYLEENPDVAAAGMNPLLHYLRHGRNEGRKLPAPSAVQLQAGKDIELLRGSALFDEDFYLDTNKDVREAGIDPLDHYVKHGTGEGRWPNPWFDGRGYVARFQKEGDSGNPLAHYAASGPNAPSWTSDRFDGAAWLARCSDARESDLTPLEHFLLHGVDQGRSGAPASSLRDHLARVIDCRTVDVTIVLAVHNATGHVAACLDSVLRNTALGDQDSLLIIDDASTDPAIGAVLESVSGVPGVRIVRNPENLGYTRTVNLGCELAGSDDVVLLNSDTVVGPHWLRNLKVTAYLGERTGSVTAVSDNAGAFSVPSAGANATPAGIDLDDWARAVADVGMEAFEVPTGNGFCMYLRRAMLEAVGLFDAEAFPVGYGEENDLCMRAAGAGWHHLVAPMVFVHHARSASFGSRREALAAAGQERLVSRYPFYPAAAGAIPALPEFVEARYRIARRFRALERAQCGPRPRILFVISTRIGGVPQTNADLMRGLAGQYESLALRCDRRAVELLGVGSDGYEVLDRYPLRTPIDFATHVSGEYDAIVRSLLVRHSIDLVHIRHLAWHSLNLPDVAKGLGVPVVHSFHDYYTVCPTVNLVDREGRYHPKGVAHGGENALWPDDPLAPEITPELLGDWQRKMQKALEACDAFVVSTESTRRILSEALPCLAPRGVDFHVIPHGRDFGEFHQFVEDAGIDSDAPLRILLLGNIGLHKGREVVREVKRQDRDGLLEFHLLGTTDSDLEGVVVDHGPYVRDQLPARIAAIRPHVVALLSICPETWSHTLTESWACGLPVVAIDIGAIGERIRSHGGGWLVEHDAKPEAIKSLLISLRKPGCRKAKQDEVLHWQQTCGAQNDVRAMASRYSALYDSLRKRNAV